MIDITKAIVHILDTNNAITINSEQLMDASDIALLEYISKHVEKALRDNSASEGELGVNSLFMQKWQTYKNGEIDFVKFSSAICDAYAEEFFKADKKQTTDFLMLEFSQNEESYIGFLLLPNNTCYTHQVVQDAGVLSNNLLKFYAVLPSVTQKIAGFAFINTNDNIVLYSDVKRFIDGQDKFIIAGTLLDCTKSISSKDALKVVKAAISEVSEKGGKNSSAVIAKAKVYLADNAEVSTKVDTEEMSYAIFSGNEELMQEFQQEIKDKGVPTVINVRQDYALREGKKHKIKTDTGIEITVPAEYFNNRDYIEFKNSIDGTISIAIKNIGKIINK